MDIKKIIKEEVDDLSWMDDTEPLDLTKGNFIIDTCGLMGVENKLIEPIIIKLFNSVGDGALWDSYTVEDIRMFTDAINDRGAVFYVVNDRHSINTSGGWDSGCESNDVDRLGNSGWPIYPIQEIIDYMVPKYDRVRGGY